MEGNDTSVRILDLLFDLTSAERGRSRSQIRRLTHYRALSDDAFDSAFSRLPSAAEETRRFTELRHSLNKAWTSVPTRLLSSTWQHLLGKLPTPLRLQRRNSARIWALIPTRPSSFVCRAVRTCCLSTKPLQVQAWSHSSIAVQSQRKLEQ